MTATLDLLDVAAVLGEIAKAAPDLRPSHSCRGAEVDFEVPDEDAAARVTHLLDGIRAIPGTQLYDRGYGGTIAGTPVRILITRRGRRAA